MIARLVDTAHDKFPLAGINVAFHGHHVADFEIVPVGDVDADNRGVAVALECFELIALDQKFRIDVKKRIGIHGQAREELVLVDVHAGEPHRVSHFVDAGHLRDAIPIGERQGKDEGNRVAGDQPVRRRGLDTGVPGSHHRLQQRKGHDRNTHAGDG